MTTTKFKGLTQQVRWCLENVPETRNCDIALMIQIWKKYYVEWLFTIESITGTIHRLKDFPSEEKHSPAVCLCNIANLPREDHIKRIRAKIQNQQKEFLPTEEAVAIARGLDVEWWREEMRKVI